MRTDTFARLARGGALTAAPLGLILLAVAFTVGGADDTTMASPAVIVANVAGLAAAVALLLGLVWAHLHTRAPLGDRGGMAMTVSVIGAALVVGATWSSVFVAPALELAHPGLVDEPLGGVVAGYMISHAILGLGVLSWTIVARRAGAISKGAATTLVIGGIVCLAPLPGRFIVVAVGLLLLAIHDRAAAPGPAQAQAT